MADDELSVRRSSRLTPLISSQLQLSTPPCSRQNTIQNTEKPTKRVVDKSRTGVPHPSRRKTSRAIFETEHVPDETNCGIPKVETPQITLNMASGQHPIATSRQLGDTVSDKAIAEPSVQDRKRAAIVQVVEVSPKSTLTQKKMHKKIKKKESSEVEIVEAKAQVAKKTALKRAMSSYSITSGSVSSAPVVPPRLLRSHASEQFISVNTSAPPPEPILPTVYSSKHPDLNVITPETVAKVLKGDFKDQLTRFELLDCRFPFEFEGGSLKGASSLCDPEKMETQFFVSTALEDSTRTALIFFCEFSANRAPKMLRHVRNVDRRLHADSYPELYFPELYLIDGGYKHCFETLQHEICAPSAMYVTMEDERFVEQCRRAFAVWRRRWKPHKVVANCAAKLEKSPQFSRRNHHHARSNIANGVRSLFDEL